MVGTGDARPGWNMAMPASPPEAPARLWEPGFLSAGMQTSVELECPPCLSGVSGVTTGCSGPTVSPGGQDLRLCP